MAFATVLEFPLDGQVSIRQVVLRASTTSLLLNGSYSLAIGDTSGMVPQTPFEFVHGQVFLGTSYSGSAAARNPVTVQTVYGLHNDSAQHWVMNSHSLTDTGTSYTPSTPGKWMQEQMVYNHFTDASGSYCGNCTLLYNDGGTKNFTITCGNNRDSFVGVNVSAHVSVNMVCRDEKNSRRRLLLLLAHPTS